MKRIRVNKGKVGLVMKNGNYSRVLTAGSYWLAFTELVVMYDLSMPFVPSKDLSIYLEDAVLAEMLTVLEVKDNEIALQYENGIFVNLLTAGRYAFWKELVEYDFKVLDLNEMEVDKKLAMNVKLKAALVNYIRVCKVESYEKAILFYDGKMQTVLTSGSYYFWKNEVSVDVKKVDVRQLQLEISGQEILTKDKAPLRVNFYAQYKVVVIEQALLQNKDYEKQLYVLIQLALREFVGTLTLDEILAKKEEVGEYVMAALKAKVVDLGVQLISCGIRDVILPGEIRDIMNQVLIAEKRAQANTITRREETAATRSLLNTAKLMEENEMLLKLKEMEYVEKIADKINSISVSGGNQVVDQLKDIFIK